MRPGPDHGDDRPTNSLRVTAGNTMPPAAPLNRGSSIALVDEDDNPREDATERPLISDTEFKLELERLIPQLRAFARSLCGHRELADDLAQEALMKAWAARDKFQPGTNLRAWLFIILRNIFLSQMRRARFRGDWDEGIAARTLSAPAAQEHQMHVSDLQRALMRLPAAQREALILVGAGGFSYEEAAKICDCAVGTIKSRVARARTALERMFTDNTCPPRAENGTQATEAADAILNEVDKIVES